MKVGEKYRVTGVRLDGEEFGHTGIIAHIFESNVIPKEDDICKYYNIQKDDEVFAQVNKPMEIERVVLEHDGLYCVFPMLPKYTWRKVYDKKEK